LFQKYCIINNGFKDDDDLMNYSLKQETFMKDKYLVIGASGTIGGEIVKLLRNKGHQVTEATSKSVDRKNENQVHVNLATVEGLKDAIEKIDRAFFISPPWLCRSIHHFVPSYSRG
jgi:nucleoside-diphosphate-sugar epimerase